MKTSKKYSESIKKIEEDKAYPIEEAVKLVKEVAFATFDETIEAHFNLNIDPRHADQIVRGTITLPHGTGKQLKIAVVSKGEALNDAKEAGADEVGSEDLIEKIQGGWLDFDLLIVSPDMMSKVGRLGKILGAKGLMPSPKNGTVTKDIGQAVKEFKAGKIEYRNDKNGILHVSIGKVSFDENQILENLNTLYDAVKKAKPQKLKGTYLKSFVLAPTMGPGIKVEH